MDSMTSMQQFLTPAGFGQAEFEEKRSRFIGRVWNVSCETVARELVTEISQEHIDAAHNVYAYIVRSSDVADKSGSSGAVRYSDDGEPAGTAGMPVLNVLQKENLHDVLCIVTRYYGGIRLGAGGLVRAYSQAAKMAVDAAGITIITRWRRLLVSCSYGHYDRVCKLTAEASAAIDSVDYGAGVNMTILVVDTSADALIARITDVTAGSAEVQTLGYADLPAPTTF
jgi:uncharacterized YigZ family protein